METFRSFLQESEEKENVKKMISKLPKKHQKLLHGYKFKYTSGNTLSGDDGHIGVIYKDKITVASPWNYGREFTTLHEIAHLVYEYLMDKKLKKEWEALFAKYKTKQMKTLKGHEIKTDALNQNAEEIFCMAYAAAYAKHPPVVYHVPQWIDFIKNQIPG